MESVAQGGMQAERQEGHEDIGFDTVLKLVQDDTTGQIAFEVFEGLFGLNQKHVKVPDAGGIFRAEAGAQKVAAFTPPDFAHLVLAQCAIKGAVGGRVSEKLCVGHQNEL